MLVPKLVTTMKGYTRAQLVADLSAGVIVGIVALPLAIAFAIASGVTPDRGLWTAIVAGFLISALGGSRVQIGGPTGAFVVIVYGIVQQHGVDGLLVATLMAGVILVAMGVMRLGVAIKFIPHPLVIGFTSGIAVIIASTQVKDFFGLRMGEVPAEFVEKWAAFAAHITTVDPTTVLLSSLALLIIIGWPRFEKRIPGPFVALIVVTALAQGLDLPVETIGSRFGEISSTFPQVAMPALSFTQIASLVGPALTIAMLAAVESLLSAVVADGMIGGRHRSNMELVAQGVANIGSALVGGIPATGAIARTATNVKNGGRTPVAGITHALVLLLITLFAGRWATMIPLAALAAILLVVAYHMSEWRVFRAELRGPRSDVLVLVLTFALTVLVDLTVAIGVGVVLASFLFTRQMAEASDVRLVSVGLGPDDNGEPPGGDEQMRITASLPAAVQVYEVRGAMFFGAAATFRDTMSHLAAKPRFLIIRMRAVPAIDSSGLSALRQFLERSRADGIRVLLTEVQAQPLSTMRRAELLSWLGDESLFATLDGAVDYARAALQGPTPP
ncbi:MAG TPA: SulP family inorganic anion transporter [Gemmatimonadaceae bacterium]|nr:SulP family inorganic anion transporter [Gemmatimonadaceae bacterium]